MQRYRAGVFGGLFNDSRSQPPRRRGPADGPGVLVQSAPDPRAQKEFVDAILGALLGTTRARGHGALRAQFEGRSHNK